MDGHALPLRLSADGLPWPALQVAPMVSDLLAMLARSDNEVTRAMMMIIMI